jgi:uncharacterized protein (UPF0147 family)
VQGAQHEKIHPLASKEEMIRDRFERFEDRVYRLRDRLVEVEPDNASRLGRVLQRAGELGLSDRLDTLVELLRDPSSLTNATDAQSKWLSDVDRLLAVLLERDSENEQRKQDIDRLQDYYDKVARILDQQKGLRRTTGETSEAGRSAGQLDEAIRRVDALLRRQADLAEETGKVQGDSAEASGKLGDPQEDLSRDTAQLAEDLQRSAGAGQQESAAGAEAQESSAGETQASSEQSSASETKAAAQAVQRAANSMSAASQSLQKSDAAAAASKQKAAMEALREARERLEEAKRKLDEQPDIAELADEQQQLEQETGDLSAQMQQDAAAGDGSQGQQGGQSSGQQGSSPGQQSLDQAQGEMQDATEALGRSSPQQATPPQDRAIDRLQQAKKELEKALNQLRQEQREETLRDLEARFREMLSRQRPINEATIRLDRTDRQESTSVPRKFRRAEQLELADLSTEQRALSQDAATCLHILDEDGTTIAFPRVMEQLSDDMATVADRLAAYRVAVLTQTIEQEIVDTLEQLLEAVQQMQRENEQQSGASGMPMMDGDTPLLPPSAELKLLRASQVRINTRTQVIASARSEQTDSEQALGDSLRKVARRQVQCAEIAQEMRDRQGRP